MYVLLLGLKWALTQNKFSAAHHPKLSEQSGPGGHAPPPPPPIFWQISKLYLNQGPRRDCGHVDVGMCPHQVLAATLTLFQPGGQVMPTLYWCPHQVLKATGAGGTGYAHFITPRFLDVLTALPSQTAKLSWEGTLSYYLSSAVSAAHPCLQRSSCSD